jgi:hypothetical protein
MLFRETGFAYIYWREGDGSIEDQEGLDSMAEQTFDARRMAQDPRRWPRPMPRWTTRTGRSGIGGD